MARTDSKFHLVHLAAKRAREINSYYAQLGEGMKNFVPPLVSTESNKPLTVALEEIAAGKIEHVEPTEDEPEDPLAFIESGAAVEADIDEGAGVDLEAIPGGESAEDSEGSGEVPDTEGAEEATEAAAEDVAGAVADAEAAEDTADAERAGDAEAPEAADTAEAPEAADTAEAPEAGEATGDDEPAAVDEPAADEPADDGTDEE